ncbi:MAG TPA: cysteine--tRNA ligase [Sphaerochaeta sp.]|jgi:cysteinyl-tRNA synthetase|nr:cysteine--tRNA ligase [Spirochaetales bacterium]HPX29430.1 cysteine--tRNA ligase [Sphaerochaeta sp.]
MALRLYNTMSRSIEEFIPITAKEVGMYSCGPTVYNYAHIGNLRTFLFEDLLKRVLIASGFEVNHVMNITDVGHLSGDGDDGEDKLERAAREKKKSAWEIADYYTEAFLKDFDDLKMIRPDTICKATDHIQEMIDLILRLEEKGHTYQSGGNVYFSIDTIDDYGKLARLDLDQLQTAVREGVEEDEHKRNPKDFVLWFTRSKFGEQEMMWPSPWGRGFPGWHIECSAMSMTYLGEQFDIHCGGIDAIPVHHTNEIAQSEAATGKKWVNYWLHGEFLLDETGRMSKSRGGFLTLSLLKEKGFDPMDYRYFTLGGHYRSQLRFNFDNLASAQNARTNIVKHIQGLLKEGAKAIELTGGKALEYKEAFLSAVQHDLNTPKALSTLWAVVKSSDLTNDEQYSLMLYFNTMLGLGFDEIAKPKDVAASDEALRLLSERNAAKAAKDWSRADHLRAELLEMGYVVKDLPSGSVLEEKM